MNSETVVIWAGVRDSLCSTISIYRGRRMAVVCLLSVTHIPRSVNTRPPITVAELMKEGRGTGGDGGRKEVGCRGRVTTLPMSPRVRWPYVGTRRAPLPEH